MVKTNGSILFLLCREDDEKYQSIFTREDMCGVLQNFIFYEIVRNTTFNFSQQPRELQPTPCSFSKIFTTMHALASLLLSCYSNLQSLPFLKIHKFSV
jgi:hypothetical protein